MKALENSGDGPNLVSAPCEAVADRHNAVEAALGAIRPAMQADGGGVELVGTEGDTVLVRLRGTCLSCPSAGLTLRFGIEAAIRERVPWVRHVIRVPGPQEVER